MGAALRPSQPPPMGAKALPLSLRAGEVPRSLRLKSPTRGDARARGAADLEEARQIAEAAGLKNVSYEDVAAAFGLEGDKQGAQLVSGKALVSYGEVGELFPLPVVVRAFVLTLRRRIRIERAAGLNADSAALVVTVLEQLLSR